MIEFGIFRVIFSARKIVFRLILVSRLNLAQGLRLGTFTMQATYLPTSCALASSSNHKLAEDSSQSQMR